MALKSRDMQKLVVMMRFAEDLAKLSTCKRMQTAAVIVPVDFTRVLAIGYNGPPAGLDNQMCSGVQGECGCVHAEVNACLKLSERSDCFMVLSRGPPCWRCAGAIVNSTWKGLSKVIYGSGYRDDKGLNILRAGGLSYEVFNDR